MFIGQLRSIETHRINQGHKPPDTFGTRISELQPCPCRFGRVYDDESGNNKAVMTCGAREVEIAECIICNAGKNKQLWQV